MILNILLATDLENFTYFLFVPVFWCHIQETAKSSIMKLFLFSSKSVIVLAVKFKAFDPF